jgi:hypothetical protein
MALMVTVGLTAFVLGMGSWLAWSVFAPAPVPATVPVSSPAVTADGTAAWLARDQEYQARLIEANRRIQQANAQLAAQRAQAQLSTAPVVENPVIVAPAESPSRTEPEQRDEPEHHEEESGHESEHEEGHDD